MSMRMPAAPLVLAMLALPHAAAAQPGCDPDGTQVEMNACAQDELAAADAELNAVYRQVMELHKDEAVSVDRLRAAQRLWIQLRDADLEARFPLAVGQDPRMVYGTIYPLEYASEKAELTRARTQYLRTFLPAGAGR